MIHQHSGCYSVTNYHHFHQHCHVHVWEYCYVCEVKYCTICGEERSIKYYNPYPPPIRWRGWRIRDDWRVVDF